MAVLYYYTVTTKRYYNPDVWTFVRFHTKMMILPSEYRKILLYSIMSLHDIFIHSPRYHCFEYLFIPNLPPKVYTYIYEKKRMNQNTWITHICLHRQQASHLIGHWIHMDDIYFSELLIKSRLHSGAPDSSIIIQVLCRETSRHHFCCT